MIARGRDRLPREEPGARRTSGARLHDQAFEILAARIRSGAIPAGVRLLESRVAADFGISRAPARQALAALGEAGLAVRSGGRGYLVAGLAGGTPGSAAKLEPVQLSPSSGWERIYREVELGIVSRTAFGSWRVIEAEIAAHHRVSRTVARDVVGRLNQRGIVRKDGPIWYAPALTPGHVAELYEMRWTLEPLALEKAAGSIPRELTRQALRSIEDAIARAEALTGADLDALEVELHVTLLAHCNHRALMEALRSYQSLLAAHSFLYRWLPPLYPSEPFLPEHRAVLTALEAGFSEEAAAALRTHLQASLERALARIEAVAAEYVPEPVPYLRLIERA